MKCITCSLEDIVCGRIDVMQQVREIAAEFSDGIVCTSMTTDENNIVTIAIWLDECGIV